MATRPQPTPVTDLDERRLTKLLDQRRTDAARLAETDAHIADLCRKWSGEHGYPVILRADQVLRAIAATPEKEHD